MNQRRPPSKRRFIIGWTSVITLVAALVISLNAVIFTQFRTVFNNFFQPSLQRSQALTEATADITERIEAEGIVLLRNDDAALPLGASERRVNVFGWSSTMPVYGGTGSGAVDASSAVTFLDGLTNAGIEYNTEITDFYTEFRQDRPTIAIRAQDWTVPEPSMDEYNAARIFESAESYSDTAVVMLSRSGGEGADIARSLDGLAGDIQEQELPDGRVVSVGVAGSEYPDDVDAAKHYLELSNRERAMLERVTGTFDKVIVIVNTGNTFELGWTTEMDVDAVAWIGGPGESGFNSVARMLTGEVNPSGRTVDTWPYDLLATPTMSNFGRHHYTDSDNVDAGDVPIGWSGDPATSPGYQFVNYAEGLYLGYRYYETYYADDEAAYAAAVQYPFGYGLSYTTFSQQLGELTATAEGVEVNVTVTNTGDRPGKDVVQLYLTAPYTNGGIEKSEVALVAFDKTAELAAGASETVTLRATWEDMASYDYRTTHAYVVEQGDYEFKLMSNAHQVIDSATTRVDETIVYDGSNKRSTDNVVATNQFDGSSGEVEVLSRANNFANHDSALAPAVDRQMTQAEIDAVHVTLPTVESAQMPVTGADNGLTLADMAGVDYDDPQWDLLLDQLSVNDMVTLVTYGGYQTEAIASIDKDRTVDIDGPQGLSSFMGASVRAGAYPTDMVLASTWNVDLANERGRMVGLEALELGVNGWYAPGMNLHRSPFGGRNFEYQSEDPVLAGRIVAALVSGAEGEGLYTYVKHFALNEQETYRNSRLLTWADEQTMRELYFRPFEYAVKNGNASAVMSAYNYIGPVWAGGNPALLQTVLRDEWGFQGVVISDYFGDYGYMNGDQAISNGNDLMLSTLGRFGATPTRTSTASDLAILRQANKNILYTVANSNVMFTADERNERLAAVGGEYSGFNGYDRFAIDRGLHPWELTAYLINGAIAAGLVALAVVKVRKYRKLFGQPEATS